MILTDDEAQRWLGGSDESRTELVEHWTNELPHDDPRKRVEAPLGELSQEVWAAGWIEDIDQRAWQLIHSPRPRHGLTPGDCLDHPINEVVSWISELAELTSRQGWFPRYDLPPESRNARMVRLSEYSRGA